MAEETIKESGKEVGGEQPTKQEMERLEAIFFEDDEQIELRDGKTYKIPPASLKDTRKMIQYLNTINADAIILNFVPTEDEERNRVRQDNLMNLLMMAFKNYPGITRDYLEEYVDLNIARKIIDILIGVNGLKK